MKLGSTVLQICRTDSEMTKDFGNFFAFVVGFGILLLIICIHREEEFGILMAEKFRFRVRWIEARAGNRTEANGFPDDDRPYDFPILEGWPPG